MAGETVSVSNRHSDSSYPHRFRLADATILLAGLGLALALANGGYLLVFLAEELRQFFAVAAAYREYLVEDRMVFWRATHDHLRNTLWYGLQAAEAFLAGMTPAFFVLRLKRPRPALRVILRNSGTASAVAMVFGLFWVTGFLFLLFPEQFHAETAAAIAVGGTVAVVWGILALTDKWVEEPSWADRLGRLLGAVSIGTGFVGLVVFRI